MPRRKIKKTRDLTLEESLKVIEKYIAQEENEILGFKNHRSWFKLKKNVYRFTLDLISLDFLISLMEDPAVKNVYYNPSVPPPGGSIDSISMRYKVYIEYNEIEE